MPTDCIKTVLELDPTPEPHGLLLGAVHVLSTGRAMVAKGGPGALFVGMAPRLAEKVCAATAPCRPLSTFPCILSLAEIFNPTIE